MWRKVLREIERVGSLGVTQKKRARRPKVVRPVSYQTGTRKSLSADRKRVALPPGKRISRHGKIYWETRRNRSDRRGSRI